MKFYPLSPKQSRLSQKVVIELLVLSKDKLISCVEFNCNVFYDIDCFPEDI